MPFHRYILRDLLPVPVLFGKTDTAERYLLRTPEGVC